MIFNSFIVFCFFINCLNPVGGSILMDINEEMSPIYKEDLSHKFGSYEEFYDPLLNEIPQFSNTIASEMQNLMEPRMKIDFNQQFDANRRPLANRIVKDFMDSYKSGKFPTRVMKQLSALYSGKKKPIEKIQVTDTYNSDMSKWSIVQSMWINAYLHFTFPFGWKWNSNSIVKHRY